MNVEDVLYIKDIFSTLPANKVAEIMDIINKNIGAKKPKINITTKGLSRKQIIIPITNSNTEIIINSANQQITNINRCLKEIKLDITADFIYKIDDRIIITTNKAIAALDLKVIKKYLKNNNEINSDSIKSPYLLMSKSYLKIIGLPYILEQTNSSVTPDIIKSIIKEMHIFNNIILALKSCIVKASPKSDMAIVWVNIWDSQNRTKAKTIINWQFNIGCYITTIYGTNMNPRVSQCKNCWK